MADWNDPIPGSNVSFWSIMACAIGSLLSLRTVVEASPLARMMSVLASFSLAFFIGPAIAEHFGLKPGGNFERAVMLLTAFLGVNFLSGVATFFAKWKADPTAAAEWLLSMWRGSK